MTRGMHMVEIPLDACQCSEPLTVGIEMQETGPPLLSLVPSQCHYCTTSLPGVEMVEDKASKTPLAGDKMMDLWQLTKVIIQIILTNITKLSSNSNNTNHHNYYIFSLNRPTGPIQSLSCNVRLLSCVVCCAIACNFFLQMFSSVDQSVFNCFQMLYAGF